MRNLARGVLLTCSFLFLVVTSVSATSWAELELQEVLDRAEVIVMGQYDFSSKPKRGESVFRGRVFKVGSLYKGDVTSPLTVGIDPYDVGWAEEFQDRGGMFLLFLEESENGKLLLPVGGPNGMIQVLDGKVEERDDERNAFFEEFLKETPSKTFEITNVKHNDKLYFPLFLIVAAFGILFILLYLNKRKSIQ
ncbi:hypothetical protein RGU12_09290 [Fredinandcohnia sp. QZ13]|uniref:hypothetical protein n=1 Tax=Fredinandcohnia sp. QZ13 TaxID=3073144 RepID=UPI00285340BC|nr:hypothetical protein [Fredinandcohnia sp. QZ13]MDR4887739.1 hypothetical protein [Fredinandcohnia sp. QZ13]